MSDDKQSLKSNDFNKKQEEREEETALQADEQSVAETNDEENSPIEASSPEEIPAQEIPTEESEEKELSMDSQKVGPDDSADTTPSTDEDTSQSTDTSQDPNAKWYVVHTYSGHENKVATALKQRVESEHLEHKILDILVPTQEKIEIRGGKKGTIKEKIFPGYILVKMVLDDISWLAVRTTQGVTSFVGMGNKPTPIPESEVRTIVKFMTQGAAPTFKDVFMVDDTVKIVDGPFSEFIGKVNSVDKEHGKVRVLVSIFGRETPVELDFLQVQKL